MITCPTCSEPMVGVTHFIDHCRSCGTLKYRTGDHAESSQPRIVERARELALAIADLQDGGHANGGELEAMVEGVMECVFSEEERPMNLQQQMRGE